MTAADRDATAAVTAAVTQAEREAAVTEATAQKKATVTAAAQILTEQPETPDRTETAKAHPAVRADAGAATAGRRMPDRSRKAEIKRSPDTSGRNTDEKKTGNNMSDRILILGAGNAQIDAIEYCKSKGYEVVGCSYTTVDNGIPYLDHFEHMDIKNTEGIIETAKKYDARLIYSVGSDVAMPTVMAASEALGLPHFIKAETAEICHSKSRMRETLGDDFCGNVSYGVYTSLEEAVTFTGFPAMMKPTDSQGQRGCFRVECEEDIRKEFQTSMDFSNEGKVIIETFLEGPEVSLNGYMKDGEMIFALVSDRVSFDEYPGGIIKEHVLPSGLGADVIRATEEMAAEAAARLGIENGPCYFQIKLDSNDQPKILEVTPRLDGCHMWNLIRRYCGADLLNACFAHLLTGDPELKSSYGMPDERYRLVFYCQAPWTKFDSSLHSSEDAEYSFYYYKDGDKVRRLNGYIEKCGYKIVRG